MPNDQLQQAVSDCQRGDSAAFGIIYDAFVKRIYDYIYFRTLHKQVAEDLTSTVFTKAFENINSFRDRRGALSAWIYTIARNTLIDHYRTHKSPLDLDLAENMGKSEAWGEDLDNRQHLAAVQGYLQHLPDDHRDLVLMRVWDELSYEEISEITGKSRDALKMSFSRIMAKLRQQVPVILALIFLAKL